ncbi:hypothetical protein M413DRAFT_132328 [Hebeloma cylindrosporum]|uniref:DUF6534 domain-containing protein n=1 Tax=Hebeloma cylindrosporum TaxID=76867 RepID=A0A0C2XXG9_HEBCY|nr:hypothetical protein M413DRAFT_132328 [Hebeloma cylindrosporum h7]
MVETTLGNTIGAAFLGILGSAVIFGATMMQVFMYYTHFKNDWKFQKFFVGWLTLVSVIHLAFAIHCVYYYVIISFGNPVALKEMVWSFKVQAMMDLIIVITVQGLYAWRVRTLGKHFSRIWPWGVVAFVGGGWAFAILLGVNTCRTPTWDEVEKFHWVLFGSFSIATFIDFLIAATLCYYLNRSRSVFAETNNRLVKVMQYVLACGFLTTICSLGALISVAALPNTLVFVGMDFLLPRMYMFSYMTMLNARRATAEMDSSSFNVTGALNHFRSANSGWVDQKPTVTMETDIISTQDAIPLANSKYFPGGKSSQQTVTESNIGVSG